MEIQYTKFHQLINIDDLLNGLDPLTTIGEINLTQYINGTKTQLTQLKENEIEDKLQRLGLAMDLVYEVEKEIDINLVNLKASGNPVAYIDYLKRYHTSTLFHIKELFKYDWIKSSKIDFNAWTEHPVGPEQSLIKTRPKTPYEKLTSLDPGMGIAFDDEGNVISYSKSVHIDPTSQYLDASVAFVGIFEQLGDFINKALNPAIETVNHEDDVFAEWRLVIPDPNRRKAYDKWTAVLKKIRETINHYSDSIATINSTNYKSGNGIREFDNIIKWGGSLTSSIVHDKVLSHEILQEIDVNLLELKTQREKDVYLFKLKNELEACASLFRGYIKTHPDYRARELDATYDEITQQFVNTEISPEVVVDNWRAMFKERQKYALQEYYIHLLVIVEVLENIINYIEDHLSPQEETVIHNEVQLANHRLLLFHKLGLFRPLFSQYFNLLGPTKFAMLIKTVLGIKEEETKSGTFKKAVENFIKEIDDVPVNKPVITGPAKNTVDAFLAEIGLLNIVNNQ